jgi:maltooligosyltrehalose trehalohydrolase
MPEGALLLPEGSCRFRVLAPAAERVELLLTGRSPVPMEREEFGYWCAEVPGVGPGERYLYRLDGYLERPDPASRWQPEGVHAPSAVVDPAFPWSDGGWRGIRLRDYLIYELHVGTFTPEGTFDAAARRLPYLRELGVTAVELMPVAQFPGTRNWGYDGVYIYAPQNSYGGPGGLRRFVDAAHHEGLSVVLDVVYNHLGPEGNYLADFGPYFASPYRTPWGEAVNLDGEASDGVREFFIGNALYWLRDFHVDALRLDAVHRIFDFGPRPFLLELAEAVRSEESATGREYYLFAECDTNDARLVRPPAAPGCGFGFDALWSDDFHHALHALLTGERNGYYADFGDPAQLALAFRSGFVYTGQYSRYRRKRHGIGTEGLSGENFVAFSQNHDQIGNRPRGDRPAATLPRAKLRLAATMTLLSPFVPLLFMGEEYGETAPFPYFVSHSDSDLAEAVRAGRREEFRAFEWEGEIPDPGAEETFAAARVEPGKREAEGHRELFAFYRETIRIRREAEPFRFRDLERVETEEPAPGVVAIRRRGETGEAVVAASFSPEPTTARLALTRGRWRRVLDSAEKCWGGCGGDAPAEIEGGASFDLPLAPWQVVVYLLGEERQT